MISFLNSEIYSEAVEVAEAPLKVSSEVEEAVEVVKEEAPICASSLN